MDGEPRVVHDERRRVFQLVVGDDRVAGYAEYEPAEGQMAITHVVVQPGFEGQGFGSVLAQAALEEAKDRRLAVLPYCWFVRAHVKRNPEYLALVPPEQRRRFGLAA